MCARDCIKRLECAHVPCCVFRVVSRFLYLSCSLPLFALFAQKDWNVHMFLAAFFRVAPTRCLAFLYLSFSLPLRDWYAFGTRLVAVVSLSLSLSLRVWYPMVFTLWRWDVWKETHGVEEHSLPATASIRLYRVKGRNQGHVLGQTCITQGPIVPRW